MLYGNRDLVLVREEHRNTEWFKNGNKGLGFQKEELRGGGVRARILYKSNVGNTFLYEK